MAKKKRKWRELTQRDILDLFRQGVYTADLEQGVVSSSHTGKPLKISDGGKPNADGERDDRHFYQLHYRDQRKKIARSVLVWLAGSGIPVPEGFEIHHRDCNYHNNSWKNLFALYRLDHVKLHNGADLIDQETPF